MSDTKDCENIIPLLKEIGIMNIDDEVISLNVIDMNHKVLKYISFAIYLFAGWAIIFYYPFNLGLDFKAFLFILFGGITYTLGALLYAIGSKKHWFHTIFHVFVLAAAVLQFIGIWYIFLSI